MKGLTKLMRKIVSLLTTITVMCFIPMSGSVNATSNSTEQSKILQYDHIEELDDGGKIYIYYIDGVENAFPVPPDGFNPVDASDEDLATYGFPPRPSNEADLIAWKKDMSYYKGTPIPELAQTNTIFGRNISNMNQSNRITPIKSNNQIFSQTSSNWSGYFSDVSGMNNKYTQVQFDYVHHTISGIAGTADTGTIKQWAWFEYLSPTHMNLPVEITSLAIHPGDNIHIYIAVSAALNYFNYYIANNTTGQSASDIVTIDISEYYDGTTAEWITEKATSNLPNFGSITMTNCKAILYTSYYWTNLSYMSGVVSIILTNNGLPTGTALCTPGPIYNYNSFTSTWNGYS